MRAEILEIRAQFSADPLGEYYRDLTMAISGEGKLSWGADDPEIAKGLRQAILANEFDAEVKLHPPNTPSQVNKIFSQLLGRKFENLHYWHHRLEKSLFSVSASDKVNGELWWVLGGKVENRYTGRKDEVYIYFGPLGEQSLERKVLMPVFFKIADFVVRGGWDDLDKCKEVFPDRQPTVCLFLDYFSSNEANQIVFQAVSQGVGAYFEAEQLFFDEDRRPLVLYPTAYTLDLGLYLFLYGRPLGNLRGLMFLSPEYQGYYLAGFSYNHQPPYYLFDRYGKKR